MNRSNPSDHQQVEKSDANPNKAKIPAFGKTEKELPDSLRPDVVDMEVIKRLGEIDTAATSDGSGLSGNVRPGVKDQRPKD
jgi:hypothetical protein